MCRMKTSSCFARKQFACTNIHTQTWKVSPEATMSLLGVTIGTSSRIIISSLSTTSPLSSGWRRRSSFPKRSSRGFFENSDSTDVAVMQSLEPEQKHFLLLSQHKLIHDHIEHRTWLTLNNLISILHNKSICYDWTQKVWILSLKALHESQWSLSVEIWETSHSNYVVNPSNIILQDPFL